MSGLYLLVLLSTWLFIGWVIHRIWKRFKPGERKWRFFHVLIGVLLFSIWFGVPFYKYVGKKMYWDAKVREWCAKDGGVKVFETVELTPDLIDWAGRIHIPYKKNTKPSDKYYMETEQFYFRVKDPIVYRRVARIIRRNDKKILGKKITYHRGGGDLPGFWYPSSFSCPNFKKGSNFEPSIFIKGNKE